MKKKKVVAESWGKQGQHLRAVANPQRHAGVVQRSVIDEVSPLSLGLERVNVQVA